MRMMANYYWVIPIVVRLCAVPRTSLEIRGLNSFAIPRDLLVIECDRSIRRLDPR